MGIGDPFAVFHRFFAIEQLVFEVVERLVNIGVFVVCACEGIARGEIPQGVLGIAIPFANLDQLLAIGNGNRWLLPFKIKINDIFNREKGLYSGDNN